jgi:isopenicillin N synthase-like dioxygenase
VPTKLLRSGEIVRNPAHSDFGTFTLLFQDSVGGLEMADMGSTTEITSVAVEKSGKFIYIEPKPEAILVNVGYLLMRWTNGRWKNIVYRVSEPPHSISNHEIDNSERVLERFSVVFFGFPDASTIVEPLSTCCTNKNPKIWGPINVGKYLLKKRAILYL